MIKESNALITDFTQKYNLHYHPAICSDCITHQVLLAPHTQVNLPRGKGAVYVFSLASNGKVLKVGRVGPKSNARFRLQHYNPNFAQSTVAGSIINNPMLWDIINYRGEPVDTWLKESTNRDHFFVDEENKSILPILEIYMKVHLRPIFEGH